MIPVEQTRFGGPDHPAEERGNCFVACLASVLELPLSDLPDVAADDSGWNKIDDWLMARGLYMLYLRDMEGYLPGWTIGSVPSQTLPGYEHVVVCEGGIPAWNPNPHDTRSLKDLDPEDYYVLYPMDPASLWGK